MDQLLVQWGSGNIGRSFIGQIFARSGYRVTFIDIDQTLIDGLNTHHGYRVREVSQEGTRTLHITGIDAVNAADQDRVFEAVESCTLLSVSVGKQVLPYIAAQLAQALVRRYRKRPGDPLNLIIAENIHNGAAYLSQLLEPYIKDEFILEQYIGLVETSIGKMVPIQTHPDSLILTAEPYNTLYVDRDGFLGNIPDCPYMKPVCPITAYVERKLYVHNLGHAAAAYFGFQAYPRAVYLPEVLEDSLVLGKTREVMEEAAQMLLAKYPRVFTEQDMAAHIEDLLYRFQNRALGDTLYRVGRDLGRKLRWDDRVLGAIILGEQLGLRWDAVGKAYLAGLAFRAVDSEGLLFPPDVALAKALDSAGIQDQLQLAAGFDESPISQDIQDRIAGRLCELALESEQS